ncbi:CLUMA_CG005432, isoform A [Clunio marinus]|uniref:CLUMA_CG005432, isoform A n=1 Tax=Clunio marinus TaxID=568069 RepID=A0A1J1HUR0_9DIPT|nr:CLUMA_CG005432, isoform A [Clunio marinus]
MSQARERVIYNITLQSEEDEEVKVIDSSSMDEMSRKRKICCGLSSCCGRTRSESAQMIAGKSSTQPLTMNQKCLNCCCWPFRKMGNPFKRRKVDGMEVMKSKKENSKPSMWERICCCSGCCRRCRKNENEESMKKKKVAQQKATAGDSEKTSCWSRMNCFKSCKPCCSRMRESCCCSSCCRKKDSSSTDSLQSQGPKIKDNATPGTCTRIFCFCCLCCRKKPEGGEMKEEKKRISMTSQRSMKKGNCCSRMCNAMICCRKKKKPSSRRTSMLSKKQSLAPTIPPPEDLKPKLDMGLVEHASLMKGAIPVLPICLAYFCLICNIIAPGTGTIFSGFFCLCIGIPRFSQHDGARGRIGSFIINSIVGVSQAFTIIFCLVGWGWSIWWGTIMLTLARRHRKIKKAERQKELDEQSGKSSLPGLARGKSRDIEKGIN